MIHVRDIGCYCSLQDLYLQKPSNNTLEASRGSRSARWEPLLWGTGSKTFTCLTLK